MLVACCLHFSSLSAVFVLVAGALAEGLVFPFNLGRWGREARGAPDGPSLPCGIGRYPCLIAQHAACACAYNCCICQVVPGSDTHPPALPCPAGWAMPSPCGWASTLQSSSSTPSCRPSCWTVPSPSTTFCSTRQGLLGWLACRAGLLACQPAGLAGWLAGWQTGGRAGGPASSWAHVGIASCMPHALQVHIVHAVSSSPAAR